MQVQRPDQVVGQEAEQEGRRNHGNQVHRALPVATASEAGRAVAVEAGAGHQVLDNFAVAGDDGEEGEEEAHGHTHVV